jgi:hypothetical protein
VSLKVVIPPGVPLNLTPLLVCDIFRYVIASGVLSERTKSFGETTMVERTITGGPPRRVQRHQI